MRIREAEIRKAVEKQAHRENDQRAPDDLQIEIALGCRRFPNRLRERERDRHADDEKEKRKDEIGRRPAVPFRVFERPVDVFPRARIVYQDHPGDRDPAKDVERYEALGFDSTSSAANSSTIGFQAKGITMNEERTAQTSSLSQ